MRARSLAPVFVLVLLTSYLAAQSQPPLNLMPMPASVQNGSGQLVIDRSFSVSVTGVHDASLDREVARFQSQLSRQTGIPFGSKPSASPTLTIHADRGREAVQKLGEDESYTLAVSGTGAQLNAPTPLGIIRGLQTFVQLVQITPNGFAAPAVTIKDEPRFPWRGLLIDVARHFIPLDVLKRNIDGMAAVKMNVLHWHLSDDQGFRVESKVFPKLTGEGSEGKFYTQDQIREFIAYAHDRGIRIVPEFDTPGHSRSWFPGYPDLASNPGPFTVETETGNQSVTDPTREETYKFLDKFVEEMGALFPDAYFHIGGDEVDNKYWDSNPKIQAFKQVHGMKTDQDLQAYYNQHLQKILAKHHKIMVGWDEILHPDLPKNIVVQSWRGQKSLAAAAQQGYQGLLSFGYYLDLMWPASRHYAVDPMSDDAAGLTPEQKKLILGGEACQWAEWVTPENIDSHIWPRNAVVAERLWSPANVVDAASMYSRMNAVSLDLQWLGLTHLTARTQMLERMAGMLDISALRTLADVVEPVKDYNRWDESKGPIDFHMPLNHMIDAVYPESETARQFSALVQTFLQSGGKDQAAAAELRNWLTAWRDNDAKLRPILEKSALLKDDSALSQNLAMVGAAGLHAVIYLSKSEHEPDLWHAQQTAVIDQAKKPVDGLLLVVADPVQQLVDAAGR